MNNSWNIWGGRPNAENESSYHNLSLDERNKLARDGDSPTFDHRERFCDSLATKKFQKRRNIQSHNECETLKQMIDSPLSFKNGKRWSNEEKGGQAGGPLH